MQEGSDNTVMMDKQQNDNQTMDITNELATVLHQVYFSILRVEPEQNRVLILQSKDRPHLIEHTQTGTLI